MTSPDRGPDPNPLAIGSWPAFCERAMAVAAEEAQSGRPGRANLRIACRMGISEASARRITGIYPAIKAMAEETGMMHLLAKIPYASAMVIATWHSRDPQAALGGLRQALGGLGTDPLRRLAANGAAKKARLAANRPRRDQTPAETGPAAERSALLWTMALGSRQVHEKLKAMGKARIERLSAIDERDGLGTAHAMLTARKITKRPAAKPRKPKPEKPKPILAERVPTRPGPPPRPVAPEPEGEARPIGAEIEDIALADADAAALIALKLASGRLGEEAVRRIARIAREEPSQCQVALHAETAAAERLQAERAGAATRAIPKAMPGPPRPKSASRQAKLLDAAARAMGPSWLAVPHGRTRELRPVIGTLRSEAGRTATVITPHGLADRRQKAYAVGKRRFGPTAALAIELSREGDVVLVVPESSGLFEAFDETLQHARSPNAILVVPA